MLVSTIMLYATLLGCAVLVGWLVVRYDLYEKEPVPMLALTTLLGAGTMWLTGVIQVAVLTRLYRHGADSNVVMALLAGTTEETGKFVVVAAIALLARRFFNEPMDGLIYGSFAGLGAALEESVAILVREQASGFLPMQEPIRLAGHLLMGGIGGYGIGLLIGQTKSRWVGIVASLAAAMTLHTLWDVVAFDAADTYRAVQHLYWWHAPAAIALMLAGMTCYRQMVNVGVRLTGAALNSTTSTAHSAR